MKIFDDKELLVISNQALSDFPDFWSGKKKILFETIKEIVTEIEKFDNYSKIKVTFSYDDTIDFQAVWILSGSGSLEKPLIDTPSDNNFGAKYPWYAGSDMERLRYAEEIIIGMAVAKKSRKSRNSSVTQNIISDGPYLIYNGVEEQNKALLRHAGKDFAVPREKICIPRGKITRTSDQVRNVGLPKTIKGIPGKIGIVSHAAHLPRVLRFIQKFKPLCFSNKDIVIFPVNLPLNSKKEMARLEMIGILDYIAKGEASIKPYNYKLGL